MATPFFQPVYKISWVLHPVSHTEASFPTGRLLYSAQSCKGQELCVINLGLLAGICLFLWVRINFHIFSFVCHWLFTHFFPCISEWGRNGRLPERGPGPLIITDPAETLCCLFLLAFSLLHTHRTKQTTTTFPLLTSRKFDVSIWCQDCRFYSSDKGDIFPLHLGNKSRS